MNNSPTPTPDYTYRDHIPQLRELMPKTGGVPGVKYLQCTLGNLKLAQDDGWGNIVGGSKVFTIVGPKGSADMHLLCKGEPLPGGDVHSGVRECVVDAKVEDLTGLWVSGPPEPVKVPEEHTTNLKDASKAIEAAVKDTS